MLIFVISAFSFVETIDKAIGISIIFAHSQNLDESSLSEHPIPLMNVTGDILEKVSSAIMKHGHCSTGEQQSSKK